MNEQRPVWITPAMNGYVGRGAAAVVLGVCSAMVHKLTVKGLLPFVETPNGRAYPVAELEKIRAERKEARLEREVLRRVRLGPRTKAALERAEKLA